MKSTRKIIIAILAIAAIMTTALLPAMAETVTPSTNNALTVTGRGPGGPGGQGGRGGQMPGNNPQGGQQMPGRQQGGQMPGGKGGQMPGNNPQMPQNDQAPDGQQNDNQQSQNDNSQQQPQKGNRQGKGFKGGKGQRDMLNLDALVKDGTLSQETKDAIDKYMSEKKQTQKDDRMQSLLDELKDAGVITDEEYEAIEAAKPDAPADGEAPADAPEMPEAPAEGEAPADAPEAPEAPETEDVPAEQADTQE